MKYLDIAISVPGQTGGSVTLTAYLLSSIAEHPPKQRAAVIICPGGGYSRRSEREAEPVALQLTAMNCHAFILHYSVSPSRFPTALLELAKAVSIVRGHAGEWDLDPQQIYVMGFSAGGHLAGSLGGFWNQELVTSRLQLPAELVKPNGMILCYPVIMMDGPHHHRGSANCLLGQDADCECRALVSLEQQVNKDTPRTFLWHTYTDQSVPVENSLKLAAALKAHNVSLELHIFPEGRHGLSLADRETAGDQEQLFQPTCQVWISLLKKWLKG